MSPALDTLKPLYSLEDWPLITNPPIPAAIAERSTAAAVTVMDTVSVSVRGPPAPVLPPSSVVIVSVSTPVNPALLR